MEKYRREALISALRFAIRTKALEEEEAIVPTPTFDLVSWRVLLTALLAERDEDRRLERLEQLEERRCRREPIRS